MKATTMNAPSFDQGPKITLKDVRLVDNFDGKVVLEILGAQPMSLDGVHQAIMDATKGMKLSGMMADDACDMIYRTSLAEALSDRVVTDQG
jgi:hypothetical protein